MQMRTLHPGDRLIVQGTARVSVISVSGHAVRIGLEGAMTISDSEDFRPAETKPLLPAPAGPEDRLPLA